ncbi:hypothetical protein QUF64_05195, partial [Anaerolineales bacterium HSG6]|nr:hypothetical protein [Anaerolineales bacterium HSG6]
LHAIIIELFEEEGGDIMPTIAERWVEQGRMESQEKVKQAEQKARQSEQKARQSEQKARQNEQKARQNEQRARQREKEAWELAFNNVRRTLAVLFAIERDQFDKRLQKLKLPALKELNNVVFEVETLAEFEATLTKLEAPPPDKEKSAPDEIDSISKI